MSSWSLRLCPAWGLARLSGASASGRSRRSLGRLPLCLCLLYRRLLVQKKMLAENPMRVAKLLHRLHMNLHVHLVVIKGMDGNDMPLIHHLIFLVRVHAQLRPHVPEHEAT